MHPISAIHRFLTALAVLGMILAPIAKPAMAMPSDQSAGMDHHAGMTADAEPAMPDNMPCCPDEAQMPDCGKLCAMMMCAASVSPTLPDSSWLPAQLAAATALSSGGDATLSGRSPAPPPRPPKA